MTTTYSIDMENNAEAWWDAFCEAFPPMKDGDQKLWEACRELYEETTVTLHDPDLITRFDAFVTGLPGWADGPEHAKEALVANAE